MARPIRIVLPGQPHHIVQRGNNRCPVFLSDDDRRYYLHALQACSRRTTCMLHSYALMSNHVHIVGTPARENGLSRMMQMVGRRYVGYFNARYERTGTLWEGRFWSAAIDSEPYFLRCSLYVDMNAYRAGLVNAPEDYPWSSARHNLLGHADELITPHPLYLELGRQPVDCQASYREMINSALDDRSLKTIRWATRRNSRMTTAALRVATATRRRSALVTR